MTNQVVYFNKGTKCISRLLVSIHSLRKHYDGVVVLLQEGPMESWVSETLLTLRVTIKEIPVLHSNISALYRKTMLNQYLDENTKNVYLDSDTVVLANIDELFDTLDCHSTFFTNFADWKTTGKKISGRIRDWEKVIGAAETHKALQYGPAINTGVFGFVNNQQTRSFFRHWTEICLRGSESQCTPKVLDELAAQVILHQYDPIIVDTCWNHSVKYGSTTVAPKIIHYHGMKHVAEWSGCATWKALYWELRNTSPHYDKFSNTGGDRRLKKYLETAVKNDLTVVSAFDVKYYDNFVINFNKWMNTEGLREQRYIVFYNGFKRLAKETRAIRKFKNITFVPWELPVATSKREEMLSAFVLGAAKNVKTKYWMKLDGDCSPKVKSFTFPKYDAHTIVAHPWGYTKMKVDPGATKHWLNTLDEWWGGVPLFPKQYHPERDKKVRHSRFCSFCYFEKTEFTKMLAARCGNRLPIPSQDTLTWYVSTRLNQSVKMEDMKSQIRSS